MTDTRLLIICLEGEALTSALYIFFLPSFNFIGSQNINMERAGFTFAPSMSPVYDALEGNRVIGEADVFALQQFRHMKPQDCQEAQLSPSLLYATACTGNG